MPSPYGLHIVESCLTCKMRASRSFCYLSDRALQAFETIKYAAVYPKDAVLFVEGQTPRGIFVVCKGRVKLSICASEGKTTMIRKIAEPGEVLGLSATISGKPYELTAETIEACQVNFVKRQAFVHFLSTPQFASKLSRNLAINTTMLVTRYVLSASRARRARNSPSCCSNGARTMASR